MKLKLCTLVLSTLFSGCASTTEKINYDHCMFPDAPKKSAPGWICDQPVEGLYMQAVGYSAKLASGPGMMKDIAAAEARNQLATSFSTDVASKLTRVTSEKLAGPQSASTDTIERIQKNVSAMEIVNSKIYRTQYSPSGNMYVLIGIDAKAYEQNINKLLNQSVDTENPELYRKFLLQEAEAALDKAAEKLK
ncbi:LPP20 family lipoprotein [Rheinheimera mangrovi]|uniref:LPP20 family lipoprotein n=1 Tax=Rheinheimera mangrovi TaxID=2498451 RepID=UPI000F8DBDDD|nr:LPP20 family lipoprotein [Rheinheimera mangrovi]